jgi:tripartite-type tricarboxylate transporter receptor subunit TctC
MTNRYQFPVLLALALLCAPVAAQSYPGKPLRVIVPYAAGGNTDITARAIGARLTEALGQQIVVENRPGAGTNIGSEMVVRAPPDGYTLLMGGAANAINMSLLAKPPYDTLRDLAPVVLCVKGANVLSVHPSLPVRNLRELIALAKARPGQLNFASSGMGGSNHMAGELFKVMAGANVVHVPYKGNTPALADTVGGHVVKTAALNPQ